MEAAAENTEFLVFIWGTSLGGELRKYFILLINIVFI